MKFKEMQGDGALIVLTKDALDVLTDSDPELPLGLAHRFFPTRAGEHVNHSSSVAVDEIMHFKLFLIVRIGDPMGDISRQDTGDPWCTMGVMVTSIRTARSAQTKGGPLHQRQT